MSSWDVGSGIETAEIICNIIISNHHRPITFIRVGFLLQRIINDGLIIPIINATNDTRKRIERSIDIIKKLIV